MKRLILIAFGALLLTSCVSHSGDGMDDHACAQNAKESYPGCRIYIVRPHYEYLAVDSAGDVKVLIFGKSSQAVITRIEEYIEIK